MTWCPKLALANIEHYLHMRTSKPLLGIGDEIHRIHTGTDFEAAVTVSDLEDLVLTLKKAQEVLAIAEYAMEQIADDPECSVNQQGIQSALRNVAPLLKEITP